MTGITLPIDARVHCEVGRAELPRGIRREGFLTEASFLPGRSLARVGRSRPPAP